MTQLKQKFYIVEYAYHLLSLNMEPVILPKTLKIAETSYVKQYRFSNGHEVLSLRCKVCMD